MDPIVLAVIAIGAGLYWYKTHPTTTAAPTGQIQGVYNPYGQQSGGGYMPAPGGGGTYTPPTAGGGAPQIPSLLQSMPPAAANGNVIALHNLAKNPASASAAYVMPPSPTQALYNALGMMGYTVTPGGPTGAVAVPPPPPGSPAPADGSGGANFSASGSLQFG